MRPGMKELMQHWRREGDEPDEGPPSTFQDWKDTTDRNALFGDVSEAMKWRTEQVGMTRSYDDGVYGDNVPEDGPKALSRMLLGLSLSINHDG
jgi:hypothetical protein